MLRIFHENFVCVCLLKAGFFQLKIKFHMQKKKKKKVIRPWAQPRALEGTAATLGRLVPLLDRRP